MTIAALTAIRSNTVIVSFISARAFVGFVTALLLSGEKPTPLLARSSSLPLSGERAAVFDRGARYGARQKYGRRAAAVKYFILLHHRLARRLWCQLAFKAFSRQPSKWS
jgi:hypothetical protein